MKSLIYLLVIWLVTFSKATELIWHLDDNTDYTKGGDNWTDDLCKNGKKQSPININIEQLYDLKTAFFNKNFPNITKGSIFHQHDKLDSEYNIGSLDYMIDGKNTTWKTVQFHFHAPAEHTVNGEKYSAEMHFRSELSSDPSQSLSFAVLIELTKDAPDIDFFEQLKLANFEDDTTRKLDFVNLSSFFDTLKGSYILKYEGSRTRPPCQEDLTWLVLRSTLKINAKQLAYFTSLWADNPKFAEGHGNNRNLQDINGRHVYLLTSEDPAKYHWLAVILIIVASLVVIAVVALIIYFKVKRGKKYKDGLNYSEINSKALLNNSTNRSSNY